MLVPSRRVPGGSGWNVYPLGHVASEDVYPRDPLAQLDAGEATPFPFTQVQPLVAISEAGETEWVRAATLLGQAAQDLTAQDLTAQDLTARGLVG
ncbi:MAG: hypothetical protein R6W83_06945 [Cryobacterium sp.]